MTESGGEEDRKQDQTPMVDFRWPRSEEVQGVDSFSCLAFLDQSLQVPTAKEDMKTSIRRSITVSSLAHLSGHGWRGRRWICGGQA